MRKTIVAGNWKMNGSLFEAVLLAKQIRRLLAKQTTENCQPILFPAAPFLMAVDEEISKMDLMLGGQDCSVDSSGSFTGDLSATMLYDAGCRFVIVGHSERRLLHHETNQTASEKAAAAIRGQLTPIICVGEIETGLASGDMEKILRQQVSESLPAGEHRTGIAVAYEPVWAIGAPKSATIEHIALAHKAVRSTLIDVLGHKAGGYVPVLYGGAVNPDNCAAILSVDNVDGVLVGRASMDAEKFAALVAIAERNRGDRRDTAGRSAAVG